jgi:hypothetical protein
MPITSGTIAYETGRKAAEEYAPATKARVEIGFTVVEGEDYKTLFLLAQAEAVMQANKLLGVRAMEIAPIQGSDTAELTPSGKAALEKAFLEKLGEAQKADADGVKPKAKPGRKPKNSESVEPAGEPVSVDALLGSTQKTEAPKGNGGGLSLDDMLKGSAPAALPVEPPKEINDNDLYAEVVKANAKLKNPPMIADLVIKHCASLTDGQQPSVKRIPMAARPAFIEDLKQLVGSAG